MIHGTLEGLQEPTTSHVLDLTKRAMGLMRQELKMNDMRESRRSFSMTLMAAEWFVKLERYQEAMKLLEPALHMLRSERWSALLVRTLSLAKHCTLLLDKRDEALLYGLQLISNPACATKATIQSELVVNPSSSLSSSSTSSPALSTSATPSTILTMDMSTSPLRLIDVSVVFRRNVVQIKESVDVELTIVSNFPKEVELNYVVLRLEQLKLDRRASLSITDSEAKGGEIPDCHGNLSYLCVVVKNGIDVASLVERIYNRDGKTPDVVITRDVISISPESSMSFDLSVVMDVPLPTGSASAISMPKHGSVIFPTFVTTGITCIDNRKVDLNIDLDSVRSADVADALSRVDAYATKTSMLSLLRPTVGERNGKNNRSSGDVGSFRFTRLIPPLSSVNIQVEHKSNASYNDWHPVQLAICMADDVADSSADNLELTLWLSNPSGEHQHPTEIQIMDIKTKKYKSYNPQSDLGKFHNHSHYHYHHRRLFFVLLLSFFTYFFI
jgi:hypothetical protein